MRRYGAVGRGCKHSEAFCLMNYAHAGGEVEVLWNSRDGVTPFMISNKSETQILTHVRWQDDIYAPEHVPQLGDRIFVDATPEVVKDRVEAFVKRHWLPSEETDSAVSFIYDTVEEAIEQITKEWTHPGSPYLVVVTKELAKNKGWEAREVHDSGEEARRSRRSHPNG